MFNNPFDSFHNTVAEAKEEREQLDRLLTISTPRERLLVAAIAVMLLILGTWFFYGNVPRSLALDGVLVEPGEGLSEESRSLQALVWVKSDIAPYIKAGISAVIELDMADGKADTLDGEVADISAVPLQGGLATLETAVPVSVHRIVVTLDESHDLTSLVDGECRIFLELGRQSPIALFRMKQS